MITIINIAKIATHLDHIQHPFTNNQGHDEPSLPKRIAGIAAFIFISLLTLGLAGGFYLYQAHWKWTNKSVSPAQTSAKPKDQLPPPQTSAKSKDPLPPPQTSTKPKELPPQSENKNVSPPIKSAREITIEEKDKPAFDIIQRFWQEEIRSFKLCHGTSALYYHHFKTHGISTTYPQALSQTIQKIRTFWDNHPEITSNSQYFRWFEQRYDDAKNEKKIAMSFTCKPSIIQEYTTGERRHGGEWVKEVRSLLWRVDKTKLTQEDQQTILEAETLLYVMEKIPAMIVKVHPGYPTFVNNRISKGIHGTNYFLHDFFEVVKKNCPDWQNTQHVSNFLYHKFLPDLLNERRRLEEIYEIAVYDPVPPEELEFEFVGGTKRIDEPLPREYPKLPFDVPTQLSSDEVYRLRIDTEMKCSPIEEYQDSQFDFTSQFDESTCTSTYTVTRRMRTPERTEALNKRENLRKHWLQALGCEQFYQEYAV